MAVGSIVDYLKAQGWNDTSVEARQPLAEKYGIQNYKGTAEQNTQLLKQLQSGATPATSSGTTTAPAPSPGMTGGTAGAGPTGTAQVGAAPGNASGSASGSTTQQRSYQRSDRVNSLYDSLMDVMGSRPDDYEMSDRVQNYSDKLDEVEAAKPDPFQSQYTDEINAILEGILNNKEFTYTGEDLMSDDLYKMYRDQYTHNAKLASENAMAGAAALTGGYGSTYSQAAAQQAYDGTMAQLNDMALEFADRAYDRYKWQQQDRYNQLGAVKGLDDTDYGRYRDTVSDWQTDRNYYAGRFDAERNFDYGQYRDQMADWQIDREFGLGLYDAERDNDFSEYGQTVAEEQWQSEFDHNKAMDEAQLAIMQAEEARAQEQWERQKAQEDAAMALARMTASGGGSSGGSKKKSSSSKKKSSSSSKKTTSSGLKTSNEADYSIAEATGASDAEKKNVLLTQNTRIPGMTGINIAHWQQEELKKYK